MPNLLDFAVEVFLDVLPYGKSVWHQDHESFGAGIVSQLSLGNYLSVPFGEIVRLLYSDTKILRAHWNISPACWSEKGLER
jgi:hypothetical protein